MAQSSPIRNIPYRRNPFFTGREEVLAQIHSALLSDQAVALTQAISGLGGIGKTQIALEYTYRYEQIYQAILWTTANSREALISSFTTIADLLDLPQKNERDQNRVIAAVKRWLREHTDWLLIVDNIDDLAIASEFLPTAYRGHMLLTTRVQAAGTLALHLQVEKMVPEVGAFFLLRRAGFVSLDALAYEAGEADQASARAISEVVDGFPLALDQAGAFIKETACNLSDYLNLYQNQQMQLLRERGKLGSEDYPASVATTWSLSFEKVAKANPAAAELLRFCAFLSPEAIPEEVITEGVPYLDTTLQPVAADAFLLNAALRELHKYSLVDRNPDANILTIHRLVQAVLKDVMNEEQQKMWAERTVRAVNQVYPVVEVTAWDRCDRYLSQALNCVPLIKQWEIKFPEAGRLLHETAIYLEERAQYAQAGRLFQEALVIRRYNFGTDHLEVARTLDRMASVHRNQADYDRARLFQEESLKILENNLGTDHPEVAEYLNNLASIYHDQGNFTQAEYYYKQALSISEKTLDATSSNNRYTIAHLGNLGNLANLSRIQGKYAQGLAYAEQAVVLSTKLLGLEHPQTAHALNSLGLFYEQLGRRSEARKLYEQALAIRQGLLGREHPDTAATLNNLGILYYYLGMYAKAQPLLEQAVAIDEKTLGPDHPETARALTNLGGILFKLGNYKQAEKLYLRALEIREKALGLESPHLLSSLSNLADLYLTQDKHMEAEPFLRRALAICERTQDPHSPPFAAILLHYGRFCVAQGQYEEAEQAYLRSLRIRETTLGSEHSLVAQSLNYIAIFYTKQNRYAEAKALFIRAITICELALGTDQPTMVPYLESYAALLREIGEEDQAKVQENRARMIREKYAQETSL